MRKIYKREGAVLHSHTDFNNHTTSYWQEWVEDCEGGALCGVGNTKEEAELNATHKIDARNKILRLPPIERIRYILTRPDDPRSTPGITGAEKETLILIMAQMVLDQHDSL